MNCKNIFRICMCGVATVLLMECSDNALVNEPEKSIGTVTVSVSTRAGDIGIIPVSEINEYVIRTLRIYVFDDRNVLVGYHYADLSASMEQVAEFKMNLPAGNLSFLSIANEGAAGPLKQNNTGEDFVLPGPIDGSEPNMSDLVLKVKPDMLKSLTFATIPKATLTEGNPDVVDETDKKYQSPVLPMADVRTVSVVSNGFVGIGLTRSVAKMDLFFSTTGLGECYMGRGLYLYNEPQFGYLFPREQFDIAIGRREVTKEQRPQDFENNEFFNDSYIYQLNGRVVLNSGWHNEPESYSDTEHTEQMKALDINFIDADMNNPENPQYEKVPGRSVYLFANPYFISGKTVYDSKPAGDGYYLKVLVHQHGDGQEGVELHKGEMFYLALPKVLANDRISVYSIVSLDGHAIITPHWIIREWREGGGNIEFN